ncbi:hypothetical protein J2750_001855 [Methanococcoides alaskense]|uniref:Uncharacterized protein n=1 Tax=Methanococcoides alaskense TaxID=325778 RepID=A0AA90ZDB7_9EURY|nr:hypothetical protein [Methanococcoides alaskense]
MSKVQCNKQCRTCTNKCSTAKNKKYTILAIMGVVISLAVFFIL